MFNNDNRNVLKVIKNGQEVTVTLEDENILKNDQQEQVVENNSIEEETVVEENNDINDIDPSRVLEIDDANVKIVKKRGSIFDIFKKKANYVVYEKDDVVEMLNTESDFIIVDASTEEEHNEGHLRGSVNIPLEKFEELYKIHLEDKGQRIFIYSQNGTSSQRLSAELAVKGYEKIVDMGKMADYIGVLEVVKNS